jgi:hypothetical protein
MRIAPESCEQLTRSPGYHFTIRQIFFLAKGGLEIRQRDCPLLSN